jgi:hypothetical protein
MEFVMRFTACAATLGGRWGCGDVRIKMFGRLAAVLVGLGGLGGVEDLVQRLALYWMM